MIPVARLTYRHREEKQAKSSLAYLRGKSQVGAQMTYWLDCLKRHISTCEETSNTNRENRGNSINEGMEPEREPRKPGKLNFPGFPGPVSSRSMKMGGAKYSAKPFRVSLSAQETKDRYYEMVAHLQHEEDWDQLEAETLADALIWAQIHRGYRKSNS